MRAYARMAKDTQLEMDATELRRRAERRLGIMLSEQKRTTGMNKGAQGIGTSAVPQENRTPTLADVGIDKKLSSRSQRVAVIGEQAFEAMIERLRQKISEGGRVSLDISVTAKTITDTADHAGLSREHLSRELSKPHITEHLRQKIKRFLAVGAARAGVTKLALLDSPNEMVRDRASGYVLGLLGIVPESSPLDRGGIQQPGLQIVIYSPGTTVGPQIIGPAFEAPATPRRAIEHETGVVE